MHVLPSAIHASSRIAARFRRQPSPCSGCEGRPGWANERACGCEGTALPSLCVGNQEDEDEVKSRNWQAAADTLNLSIAWDIDEAAPYLRGEHVATPAIIVVDGGASSVESLVPARNLAWLSLLRFVSRCVARLSSLQNARCHLCVRSCACTGHFSGFIPKHAAAAAL